MGIYLGILEYDWYMRKRNSMYRYNIQTISQGDSGRGRKRHRGVKFAILLVAALVLVAVYQDSIKPGQAIAVFQEVISQAGPRKIPIYSVDTEEKKIALSFDAAWGAEDFYNIMDILDKHNVKVTFFMTGGWVADNPDCVKTLVEKGHELGNHSQNHYDMTTLSKSDMEKELMDVHKAVKELTGYEMKVFRPPYGAYDNNVIETASDCGYSAIQWSVDSLDWKDYGVKSIIDTVCNHKNLKGGAIILCHNGAKYTVSALDEMLTNLENQGYTIVPVSDLIMTDSYHIDANGMQIAD